MLKAGDVVKVHQKIIEKGKERIQIFEGLIIAIKGNGPLAKRITVRRIASGVGVERTFPLNLPSLAKIEVVKKTKVKRAKLYYVRKLTGRRARLEEEKEVVLPGVESLEEEKTVPKKAPAVKTEQKKEPVKEVKPPQKSTAQKTEKAPEKKETPAKGGLTSGEKKVPAK